MGKYMKKSKLTGDIAVMEVSPQSSRGVRTRAAKTLALQRLNKPSSQSAVASSPRAASSSSYLQLRSRRLEKPPPPLFRPKQRAQQSGEFCRGTTTSAYFSTSSRLNQDSENSASGGSVSLGLEEESEKRNLGVETGSGNVGDAEASFGENYLEFGVDNGGSTEKIPSSLVRDSSTMETSYSMRNEIDSRTTDSRVEMELLRSIPTPNDIEEFFAHEELWHQRTFIQKYNFDFTSDMPLQGRYEWVQVVP